MDPPTRRSTTTNLRENISRASANFGSIAGATAWKLGTNDKIPGVTRSSSSSSSSTSATSFASRENWNDVMEMIRNNPLLITPHVFGTILKHNPPLDVIDLMLTLQPSVANIPKQGPTALQLAVQHGASWEVVRAVLKACPFALCVTNPQCPEDPLSYAKRHRKKEIELIQLLSFPLSHWMALKEEEETAARSASHLPRAKEPQSDQGVPGEKPLPNEELLHSPISKSKTSPTTLTKNAIIRQELNNVKTLCAQVLKGHKKLSQQLKECQEQLEHQQPKIVHAYKLDNESFLQELHQQQMIHFRRQLIALDMKERAFLARVKQVEEQCQNQCSEQFLHWKQSMEDWKRQVDQQWKEREKKQDQEMKRNARIRQNIGQRVDQPYSPRDRTDYQVRGDHHHGQDDVTPILFSTNLGEIREYVPLYSSESSSQSSSRDYGASHFTTSTRGDPWRPNETRMPTTTTSSTTAATTSRTRPPRRHPWKAQARKLDCTGHLL